MKTKILTTIICVCALFKMQAESWEHVRSLSGENLRKVYAKGTDTVYVVGENGLIAQSANKGLTWNKQYFSNREALNDIIFCNHEVGFVVGNNGTILRTQNAGLSWEQKISGTTQNINAIAAFDLNNIWAVGNDDLIIQSTDMGETWNTKSLLTNNSHLREIKNKGSRGFITGRGVILNTDNGGIIWNEQILTQYDEIWSLSITDTKVYAIKNRESIIFTENNVDWHTAGDGYRIGATAIYFQDDQEGFKLDHDMTISGGHTGFWVSHTTDGGNNWVEIHSDGIFQGGLPDKVNFTFSTDNEFGYFVVGSRLMRNPYTGEFQYNGIGVINSENPLVTLNQTGNELQINSESKMISRVEFITIDGRKTTQKTEQVNMVNINVSNLYKGVYLLNIVFFDNTSYLVNKWIKNN